MTREEIMKLNTDYLNDCESEHDMNELFYFALELLNHEQESCGDCISRQAAKKALEDRFMELQKRHDDKRYETNFCLNTILELPPVTPQVKCEDIAKAFQLGTAMGFAEKYNSMDRVIGELKKTIATPQESEE